mmetsp:Transcript_66523/g.183760  ORF Transcript_66523/g.183760 Transcript_66523/m.183760 type:complete len:226 (-) Transcript_66523:26-703(-)
MNPIFCNPSSPNNSLILATASGSGSNSSSMLYIFSLSLEFFVRSTLFCKCIFSLAQFATTSVRRLSAVALASSMTCTLRRIDRSFSTCCSTSKWCARRNRSLFAPTTSAWFFLLSAAKSMESLYVFDKADPSPPPPPPPLPFPLPWPLPPALPAALPRAPSPSDTSGPPALRCVPPLAPGEPMATALACLRAAAEAASASATTLALRATGTPIGSTSPSSLSDSP